MKTPSLLVALLLGLPPSAADELQVPEIEPSSAQRVDVEIDLAAASGTLDVVVGDVRAATTRGKRASPVEPYSGFGCIGAESWRRRIPCKRGTIE